MRGVQHDELWNENSNDESVEDALLFFSVLFGDFPRDKAKQDLGLDDPTEWLREQYGHLPGFVFFLYDYWADARKPPGSLAKKKVGRNDPRPCGSGKKFEKCHGRSTSQGVYMPRRIKITADHLQGLPGLSEKARDKLLSVQPKTVADALRIRGVGRSTTKKLLELGLLTDPDGAQTGERPDLVKFVPMDPRQLQQFGIWDLLGIKPLNRIVPPGGSAYMYTKPINMGWGPAKLSKICTEEIGINPVTGNVMYGRENTLIRFAYDPVNKKTLKNYEPQRTRIP